MSVKKLKAASWVSMCRACGCAFGTKVKNDNICPSCREFLNKEKNYDNRKKKRYIKETVKDLADRVKVKSFRK